MAGKRRSIILWGCAAALLALAARPFSGSLAAPAAQPELTLTPTATPTATTTPSIDIDSAMPISCGQGTVGTTVGAVNHVSVYGCAPWLPETGPERVFSLSLQASSDVDALLGGMNDDLDLFLLTGASPASCIAFGDNAVSARGLPAGTYYLVVDGFDGAAGSFRLDVWCPLAVTATPTPTVTPTATPRPTVLQHYLPLLFHSTEARR